MLSTYTMATYLALLGSLGLARGAPTETTTKLPDPLSQPWLGYGINIEPQPGGGTSPGLQNEIQILLDDTRIGALKPQVARVTWTTLGFAPNNQLTGFDWNTNWARNEFQALDRLKARNIPIMTGWWDTPWDATSLEHANAVADFLEYLIKTKGYTNIFAWDGINEPNHRDPTSFARWKLEVANIREAMGQRGLSVQILGPGIQDVDASTTWLESAATEMPFDLAAYDCHYYPWSENGIADGEVGTVVKGIVSAANNIDKSNKPFYMEEMGWKYGYDSAADAQPNVLTYSYGLNMADMGIQVVRAGVSAPMAWRLSDAGSPRTWGMYNGTTTDTALRPWAYSWTMLTHAFPKGSTMYAPADATGVRTLIGSTGSGSTMRWSLASVNRGSSQVSLTFSLPNAAKAKTFKRFSYVDGNRVVDLLGFPASNGIVTATSDNKVTIVVPANSFVVITNAQ